MPTRLRALKRTLFASAALFASLLALLSVQMLLGRDPAVHRAAPAAATQLAQKSAGENDGDGTSVLGSILSLAGKVISDDDHEGDDDGSSGAPAVRSQTS